MENRALILLSASVLFLFVRLGSADRVAGFIQTLEDNGMFHEAITEYRRILFYSSINDEEEGLIWLRMGVCYREINDEAEMMKAFNHAFSILKENALLQELYLELAVFYLARERTGWARLFLARIDRKDLAHTVRRYSAMAYMIEEDWDNFLALLKESGIAPQALVKIRGLITRIKKLKRRFQSLKTMEFLVPGIGHIVESDFLDGGESLVFHGFFVYQILTESSWPARIIFALGLSRIYTRSMTRNRKYFKDRFRSRKLILEEQILDKMDQELKP